MKYLLFTTFLLLLFSCNEAKEKKPFTTVVIETIYEDSLSIRAIELIGDNLAFSANKGFVGNIDLVSGKVFSTNIENDSIFPEFRSIAHTTTDVFVLSVANPALLYKTGENGRLVIVYKEVAENVFYDAMTFWNDMEGVAIGDSMNGCLSMIITRDGGLTWNKQECSSLPNGVAGEGAFAASNTNIKTMGYKTWVATTNGRVYFSPDKGKSWEAIQTPIINKEPTQGIYTLDFYDDKIGFAMGGDYTKAEINEANKAVTQDGGKSWQLVADGNDPGYVSCVQFVPNSDGKGIVATSFNGIYYSSDMGVKWKKMSDEGYYTIRFKNDSIAYAAGKGRLSKLNFK